MCVRCFHTTTTTTPVWYAKRCLPPSLRLYVPFTLFYTLSFTICRRRTSSLQTEKNSDVSSCCAAISVTTSLSSHNQIVPGTHNTTPCWWTNCELTVAVELLRESGDWFAWRFCLRPLMGSTIRFADCADKSDIASFQDKLLSFVFYRYVCFFCITITIINEYD